VEKGPEITGLWKETRGFEEGGGRGRGKGVLIPTAGRTVIIDRKKEQAKLFWAVTPVRAGFGEKRDGESRLGCLGRSFFLFVSCLLGEKESQKERRYRHEEYCLDRSFVRKEKGELTKRKGHMEEAYASCHPLVRGGKGGLGRERKESRLHIFHCQMLPAERRLKRVAGGLDQEK